VEDYPSPLKARASPSPTGYTCTLSTTKGLKFKDKIKVEMRSEKDDSLLGRVGFRLDEGQGQPLIKNITNDANKLTNNNVEIKYFYSAGIDNEIEGGKHSDTSKKENVVFLFSFSSYFNLK
jgi:hypothetical protein